MNIKKSLKPFVVVFLVGSAYDIYTAISSGVYHPFRVIPVLITIGLIYSYLKKPEFGFKFLFYSILPIYPAYFAAIGLDIIDDPLRREVALFMGILYLIGVFYFWKKKKEFDKYFAEMKMNQPEAMT